jgi:methanethiol S-methyltransferase
MNRIAAIAFSVLAYGLFGLSLVWLLAFLTNIALPITIDRGDIAPPVNGVVWNVFLLTLFGLQHSFMARPGFKRWWERYVSPSLERSLYVFISSAFLIALCLFWKPMAGIVWQADSVAAQMLWWAGLLTGLLWLVGSSFLTDHFELLGLKQAWLSARECPMPAPFVVRSLYRLVRHPIYVGWLLLFWCTPQMTWGHLLFATGMSIYTVVGIRYEERDLVASHGPDYTAYREAVPALVPGMRSLRRFLVSGTSILLAVALLAGGAVLFIGTERTVLFGEAVASTLQTAAMERIDIETASGTRQAVIANSGIANPERMFVLLHGAGGNANRLRLLTSRRFEAVAGKAGSLIVYPEGYGGTWNDCRSEPDYPAIRTDIDDVGFLETVITKLRLRYGIAAEAVVVAGFSNGGHMALRLAIERPELMGGIAIVGAQLPELASSLCPLPEMPLNFMLVAGTADPVSPFEGGDAVGLDGGRLGRVISVDATSEHFVGLAGAEFAEPSLLRLPELDGRSDEWVERREWQGPGGRIRLYIVHNGGHAIPGYSRWFPPEVGNVSADMDFAEEVLTFMNSWNAGSSTWPQSPSQR